MHRTLSSPLALFVTLGLCASAAQAAPTRAPSSLTATAVSSSAIDLAWDDPNDRETGYRVERGLSTSSFQAVASLPANTRSYRDAGLAGSTTYYYRVAPIASGKAVYSPVASATTLDTVPPSTPGGVSASATGCGSVAVSWNASTDTGGSGLKGYNVYRNGAFLRQVAAPATSTTDTGVAASQTYGYTVVAVDNAGNTSGTGGPASATTPACADSVPPSTPTGLVATATGCGSTSLSWSASTDSGGSGLKAYNVYRNGVFLKQVAAPATSTSDSGLAASTSYTYRVSALDNAGNQSSQSTASSTTTPACGDTVPPSTPTGLLASAITCSSTSLVWNAAFDTGGSGLKGYNVYRNGVFLKQVPAPSVTTTDSGLAATTSYSYNVTAVDNAGNVSSLSSPGSTTTPACSDTIPPSTPINVTASATSCSSIQVSWSPSTDTGGSGLRGYNVYRNGAYWTQVLAPDTSVADTGRSAGTQYLYTVIAVDNAFNGSGVSSTAAATTPLCSGTTSTTVAPTTTSSTLGTTSSTTTTSTSSTTSTTSADSLAPTVPTGLTASPVACNQVSLAWNASSDAGSGVLSYLVFRDDALLKVVNAPATSTADTTVTSSRTYRYEVSALDAAGNQSGRSTAATTTTPACPGTAPELVGFVPAVGAAKAVALVPTAGLAYVASMEFGVSIVDVTVPTSPRATGASNPAFYGERIAVSGSLAAVSSNNLGLSVVDISNRAAPRTVGWLAGTMKGVAMAGSYAYAIQIVPGNPARTDLVVIDLRTPSVPAVVGRVALAGGVEVELSGSYAYVAAASAGLQIVDVSSPTGPRIVGSRDTPGWARAVSVSGNWAYVADDTSIQVVDVSNKSNPQLRASLASTATAVAASGARLYALGSGQLKIIDVANPLAPALQSATDARGGQWLAANGNLVYVASPQVNAATQTGGLYIVDASSPTSPVVRSNLYGGFDSWSVDAAGSLGVATGNLLGLRVLDLASASAPRVLASMTGTMKGVAVTGSYAYVVNLVPGNPARTDLIAVDLRTPSAPSVVGRVTVGGGDGLELGGAYAYVAAEAVGLRVVDVSTPSNLRVVGIRDTAGTAVDVAVGGTWAYVADTTSVQVVDVSAPTNPVIRGSLATAATRVALVGSRLYAMGGGQLKTIDVSTPTAPVLLGAVDGYGAQGLDARGNLAFLAVPGLNHFDTAGGVYVLDVTGTTPQLVEQLVVPGTTRAVSAPSGTDMIFAGDAAAVVDVIDIVP